MGGDLRQGAGALSGRRESPGLLLPHSERFAVGQGTGRFPHPGTVSAYRLERSDGDAVTVLFMETEETRLHVALAWTLNVTAYQAYLLRMAA